MHQKTIRIPVEITFSTDPAELDDRQGETPATKESLLAYLKDAIQLGVDTEDQGQPEGAVFVAAGVDWDAAEPVDETANCDDAIRRTTEAGDEGTAAIKIQLPCYGITIHLDHAPTAGDPGCGKLTSNLKAADATATSFNNAIDGLEALILAHACAGIDVVSPAYIEGIETAVEAIGQHYGQ